MKEVMEDFTKRINEFGPLGYIQKAGGVLSLRSRDEIPLQQKTPFIVLIDRGTPEVLHWSSARRWMAFSLEVLICQRIFERQDIIKSNPFDKGIEEIAKDVRRALDMFRFGAKYARNFLTSEEPPELITEGNMHLQGKPLIFEVVRIE